VSIDWNRQHVEQLDWYWRNQFRPRLEGLSDDEYFWEPVPGCWSLRKRGASQAPMTLGAGGYLIDIAAEELDPPPVTTIAWRLAHIIVGCFAMRLDIHFDAGRAYHGSYSAGYGSFRYGATADGALDQLDDSYPRWIDRVREIGTEGLTRPSGPDEGEFADEPFSTVVLHINREVMHHGGEIGLLRDLYRRH
jgi:hypothetical protein